MEINVCFDLKWIYISDQITSSFFAAVFFLFKQQIMKSVLEPKNPTLFTSKLFWLTQSPTTGVDGRYTITSASFEHGLVSYPFVKYRHTNTEMNISLVRILPWLIYRRQVKSWCYQPEAAFWEPLESGNFRKRLKAITRLYPFHVS